LTPVSKNYCVGIISNLAIKLYVLGTTRRRPQSKSL
jgi:hypothetical protein